MRVAAYRNLKKPGVVYSLMDTRTGLVAGYADDVLLGDVKFTVRQKGRERVLREGRKNVHAFVRGTIFSLGPSESGPRAREVEEQHGPWQKARYNPYIYTSFVRAEDEAPIFEAKYARLSKDGLEVILPAEQARFSGRRIRVPSKRELLDEMLLWQD
jgi:hypothetical protein